MSPSPTRRRLTAEERRAGILDAALAVFSARGYHASSIDDIAREAGISKALIYEHFDSKQGLYADLLERNATELFERLASPLAGVEVDSGAARLATGLDAFFTLRRGAPRRLAHPLPRRGPTRRPRPPSTASSSRSPPSSPR